MLINIYYSHTTDLGGLSTNMTRFLMIQLTLTVSLDGANNFKVVSM